MRKNKKTLGIIGFGGFGKFMTPHLLPYFNVFINDVLPLEKNVTDIGASWGSLKEVAGKDVVVICVPVQFLESVLIEIYSYLKPHTLVVDVSSVKVKPVELMLKHLPSSVEILGTHPLFGPQSGKNGIVGLNMVLSPVRTRKTRNIAKFLGQVLGLNILERTPDVHDQQMAYVQALTHFIGRAINEMDIPDVEQKTPAYQYLLDIKRNLGQDSIDLFYTIELENPYALNVRQNFIKELHALNERLEVQEKKRKQIEN
jgi:prephenate dehydrogenase